MSYWVTEQEQKPGVLIPNSMMKHYGQIGNITLVLIYLLAKLIFESLNQTFVVVCFQF